MSVGWVDLRSAPTWHGIPAQGETLGTRHTKPMRSEGTPHSSVGQAFEWCVSGASSARSAGTIEMGGKGWRGGFFRKTRRERGADRLRSVTSEQRSDCGRSCSQHNRSNSIVPAQKALGRIGFRAARVWVWCSPPRRAMAKVGQAFQRCVSGATHSGKPNNRGFLPTLFDPLEPEWAQDH